MTMLERAIDTAQALGISVDDALVLEFLAARAWALVQGDNRAAAIMHIGASHAAGIMDSETMRQCLAIADR